MPGSFWLSQENFAKRVINASVYIHPRTDLVSCERSHQR